MIESGRLAVWLSSSLACLAVWLSGYLIYMKILTTIVVRPGMTWKDVRRAYILAANEMHRLGDALVQDPEAPPEVSETFPLHVDGRRVGKICFFLDEDED